MRVEDLLRDCQGGNDLAVLAEAFERGAIPPGQVFSAVIAHDSTCDLMNSCGPCNCSPDVVLVPLIDPEAN